MIYHLARNGQQLGTCSKDEALARYGRGEILATDLMWCEGMPAWLPAAQVLGTVTPPPVPGQASAMSLHVPPTSTGAGVTPVAAAPNSGKPSNNLVFAILVTLFCCIPTGIVAIVYAAQVDSKWTRGEYEGAAASAKNAALWCWISLGVGVLGSLIYGGFMAFMAFSSGAY